MSAMESQNDPFELLLEEHVKLRGLLNDLKTILAQRAGPLQEVVGKLRELQDQVSVHFQAEEASDCFPDLVSHAPRVSERVAILLAEHGELRAEVHQIAQDAAQRSGAAHDWQQLATAIQEFTAKLLNHEQLENELVQEVFTDDIGSKD